MQSRKKIWMKVLVKWWSSWFFRKKERNDNRIKKISLSIGRLLLFMERQSNGKGDKKSWQLIQTYGLETHVRGHSFMQKHRMLSLCRNNLSRSRGWEWLCRQLFCRIASRRYTGWKTEQKPTVSNRCEKEQNSQKHRGVICETHGVVFSLLSAVRSSAGGV